jgi:hypothetical protein
MERSRRQTHPVAIVWFAEDIEVVSAGRGVPQPGLVKLRMVGGISIGPHHSRADDIPFVLVEGGGHLTECGSWDGDFDVVVRAGRRADEQVQGVEGQSPEIRR